MPNEKVSNDGALPKSTISSELCDRFSNSVHWSAAKLHGDLLTQMISVVFASDPERFISLGFTECCISLWVQILLKRGADFSLSTLALESMLLQQLVNIQSFKSSRQKCMKLMISVISPLPGAILSLEHWGCVHILILQNCRQAGSPESHYLTCSGPLGLLWWYGGMSSLHREVEGNDAHLETSFSPHQRQLHIPDASKAK